MFFDDGEKYTYNAYSNGTVIQNLAGEDVAVIFEEGLTFVPTSITSKAKQEITDFIKKHELD